MSARDLSATRRRTVAQTTGPPRCKSRYESRPHLYVDEGITIQRFLSAGLSQRIIITRVPVLIGDGIPLFGTLRRDVRLRHLATRPYFTGENNEQFCLADHGMLWSEVPGVSSSCAKPREHKCSPAIILRWTIAAARTCVDILSELRPSLA
jgi:hypothetical protein